MDFNEMTDSGLAKRMVNYILRVEYHKQLLKWK